MSSVSQIERHIIRLAASSLLVGLAVLVSPTEVFADAQSASLATTPAERTSSHGPLAITTHVNTLSAQIAETIELTITVQAPQGVQVAFPQPGTGLGEFDVIDVQDVFDVPIADNRRWTRKYLLESLIAGDQNIPKIPITYVDQRSLETQRGVGSTASMTVSIRSLLEGRQNPEEFKPIKQIVSVTPPTSPGIRPYWLATWVGGIVVAAAIGLVWVARRRRAKISASQWAREEITRLESASDQLTLDQFYTQLADIVRHYIELSFDCAAPRQTTPEFFEQVRARQMPNDDANTASACVPSPADREQRVDGSNGKELFASALGRDQLELLQRFLSTADLVKFAGMQLDAADIASATADARRFIEETSAADQQRR